MKTSLSRIMTGCIFFSFVFVASPAFAQEQAAIEPVVDAIAAEASDPQSDVVVVPIWPGEPPSWTRPEKAESTDDGVTSRRVAGQPVSRISNVSKPELHLYPSGGATTTVVICPGGGYHILAWNLEGTEIAKRFQEDGFNAVVLKYRVPTAKEDQKWLAPVQDVQRSIALVRSGAIASIKTQRVGVLGFSAGGYTAARAATTLERHYAGVDDSDQADFKPNFAVLAYPAYVTENPKSPKLNDHWKITSKTPPMFFAHAFDDPYTCMASVGLFSELQRNGVPSSLHVFSKGGHGFGGREAGQETDYWLTLCMAWMRDQE